MKALLPMVILPFLLPACASTTSVTPPSFAEEPPAIWSPAPPSESFAVAEPKSSADPSRVADDLSKTSASDKGGGSSASPRAAEPPATSSADTSAFPERRAIEALDVLARSMPVAHDKRGAVLTLACDELFEPGSASLTSGARWQLDEIAPALAQQDGRDIEIRGYTDSLGDRSENEALSLRRAEAVRDYVVSKGAHAEPIHVAGLGVTHPVSDNGTPEGRAANRRIEIVIRTSRAKASR